MVERWETGILMSKNLLIVFAKNIVLGKVKTRLAKSIGDNEALNVYVKLYEITERESLKVRNADLEVHFSDVIIEAKWASSNRYVQVEGNLGVKMKHAFEKGFEKGYKNIICIGTDLADQKAEIIENAFNQLEKHDFVFGPAEDGGYYLVGSSQKQLYIFDNKPWSEDTLLKETLTEIKSFNHSVSLLNTLNDIDNLEDLKRSMLENEFKHLWN
ncbi:MAG: TIGR04282 family arsenosugar biosynthesis glycosyltransferase [Crocinitomicaceae bacterium]